MRIQSTLLFVFMAIAPAAGLRAQTILPNLQMTVKLLGPLSTKTNKVGDKISAQVIDPPTFRGDIVSGEVRGVKNGGKIDGKSVLNFTFDTLYYRGRTVHIASSVLSVANSRGQQNVDEEGQVIKKKNNIGKVALGTLIGAGLGAALGGGKGAAIGAGAGLAGSLILVETTVKGPSIDFAPGSEFVLSVKIAGSTQSAGGLRSDAQAPGTGRMTYGASAPGSANGASPMSLACGDYTSCIRAGYSAEMSSNWQASIDDFHAAIANSPTNPLPWKLLGGMYVETGQYGNFTRSWDRALRLGGSVGFDAWRQLAFHTERGGLQVSASVVSFTTPRGKRVFAAPPAEIRVIGAYRIQGQAYLRLRVAGRNYDLVPIPFKGACQVALTALCPPESVAHQEVLNNYIAQVIPELASGALAPTPPEAPMPPTAPTPVNEPSNPGTPAIASVTAIRPQGNQTITITGNGFGYQAPYNGDSDYIVITDLTKYWNAGDSGDLVTLNVAEWTNTQIVIQGFTGSYGNGWHLNAGDQMRIEVWNPQTHLGPATVTQAVTTN